MPISPPGPHILILLDPEAGINIGFPVGLAGRVEKLGRFPISGGSIDPSAETGNREASHFSLRVWMCFAVDLLEVVDADVSVNLGA